MKKFMLLAVAALPLAFAAAPPKTTVQMKATTPVVNKAKGMKVGTVNGKVYRVTKTRKAGKVHKAGKPHKAAKISSKKTGR